MDNSSVGIFEIFLVILVSTLFSIGGGNGPVAFIQGRWVEPGLLDPSLFAWAIALGYLTPGPNAGFLAGVGYYMYGIPGAIVAVAGVVFPTAIGAAAVSHWFNKLQPLVTRISLPAGFVIAGMIAAAAWQMALPMDLSAFEVAGAALVAVLIGWRNISPAIVVLGAAAVGFLKWLFAAGSHFATV